MHIHWTEACQYYKHSCICIYIWLILYVLVVYGRQSLVFFYAVVVDLTVSFQRTLDTCI